MILPESNVPVEVEARTHLKIFLSTQRTPDNLEFSNSAIYLLKNVPAARPAVLEYMEEAFDDALQKIRSEQASPQLAAVIQRFHQALHRFVQNSPATWASLVSAWSLRLLGFLSSKYGDKRCHNLSETMQMWLCCPPMRCLIDLTSHCMANAIDLDPDQCINALLDTTIKYSPHFDWVVAHVGSSFPHTVITRVLAVGLKHFMKQEPGVVESNKLVSVVAILGHLSGQHSADIKKALSDMVSESLVENPTPQQLSVLPFLIDLCGMSDLLLTSLVGDLSVILTSKNLNILVKHSTLWRQFNIAGVNRIDSMVVNLILKCGRYQHESLQLLSMALRIKQGKVSDVLPEVVSCATRILDNLIEEIQVRVYRKEQIPLLLSFELHGKELLSQLDVNCSWALSFISLLCLHCSEKLRFLVEMLTTDIDPSFFVQILSQIETSHPKVLEDTLNALIVELKSGRVSDPNLVLYNLQRLVAIEPRAQKTLWKFSDTLSLQSSSCSLDYTAQAIKLLADTSLHSVEMPVSSMYKIVSATVLVFFAAARLEGKPETKVNWISSALKLLNNVCRNHLAQQMAIRQLIDGATDPHISKLFGAIPKESARIPKPAKTTSLLEENRKIVASINFPQSHSSIMRAGVLGDGLRAGRCTYESLLDENLIRENQACILKAFDVCCSHDKPRGTQAIATMLTEIINPDVMFNRPVWPSEDVLKATQEKDVEIRESFRLNPLLWKILGRIAAEEPRSLAFAGILIRSLLGCQMTYWKNSQDTYIDQEQLQITIKLLNLMKVGKMLPPPLCEVASILESVESFHVYCILNDIWQFMKDTGGSPIDGPISNKYTLSLRIILLQNIEKVGATFSNLFPIE